MKKWILLVLATLVGLVALISVIGLLLPKEHTATRTVRFNQPPESLWELLTNHGAEASWRSDLERIERLPDKNGHPLWREVYKNGQTMTLETVEAIPPRRLVRRIADEEGPFGGTWTIDLAAADRGCKVRITEEGWVSNPIFRFISRVFFKPTDTMDQYLVMVGNRLGEEPKQEN